MYVTPQKGRQQPSVYYHKHGLVFKKRGGGLKFMLLSMLVAGGSITLAIGQYGKQLEGFLNNQTVDAASIQPSDKIIPLVKPIEAGVVGVEAASYDDKLQKIIQDWTSSHHEQDWSVVVQGLDGTKQYAAVRASSWYVPAGITQLYTGYSVLSHTSLDH